MPSVNGKPRSTVALDDYFTALLRRLRFVDGRLFPTTQVVGVTSCLPGEGVSTVATNLAISASHNLERPVLLLETSGSASGRLLRDPVDRFVTDAVSFDPPECLPTQHDGLYVRRWGDAGSADAAMLLTQLLDQVRADYEMIIVDLPKVHAMSSCASLASILDGVMIVVQAERGRQPVLERARDELSRAGANILGVVYNKHREHVPKWLRDRI